MITNQFRMLALFACISMSAGFMIGNNPILSTRTLSGGVFARNAASMRGHTTTKQAQSTCPNGARMSVDIRGSRRALLFAPFLALLTSSEKASAAGGFVIVLGASGETGQQCVDALVQRGKKVRAVVRSLVNSKGKSFAIPPNGEGLVEVVAGDVTKSEDLLAAIKGAEGVIFAASASSKGGDPKAVDYLGLVQTAQVCIQERVPRLVVVSSGGVSRPDSAIYKLLNLFGQIMYYKAKGEDEVRQLYRQAANPAIGYTIVRPGGLTSGPASPVAALALNQGDAYSGRIPRADVAAISVEALTSPAARDVTLECYTRDTGKPLADVGLANLLRLTAAPAPPGANGRERAGADWPELFAGLTPDF